MICKARIKLIAEFLQFQLECEKKLTLRWTIAKRRNERKHKRGVCIESFIKIFSFMNRKLLCNMNEGDVSIVEGYSTTHRACLFTQSAQTLKTSCTKASTFISRNVNKWRSFALKSEQSWSNIKLTTRSFLLCCHGKYYFRNFNNLKSFL